MAQEEVDFTEEFRKEFGIDSTRTATSIIHVMQEAYETQVLPAFRQEPDHVRKDTNENQLAAHFALTVMHIALTSLRATVSEFIGPENAFAFEADVSERVQQLYAGA